MFLFFLKNCYSCNVGCKTGGSTLYWWLRGNLCSAVLSRSIVSNSSWPHGPHAHQAPLSLGILQARILEWLPCPPLGDLPNPEIEPRFPAFQADSLPSEPLGKPMNTGVGSLPILQGIFLMQELNQGVLHCKQIVYQLGYQWSCRESFFYFNKLRQSSVHLVSIYTFITYCICLMNHLLRNKNTFKTVL